MNEKQEPERGYNYYALDRYFPQPEVREVVMNGLFLVGQDDEITKDELLVYIDDCINQAVMHARIRDRKELQRVVNRYKRAFDVVVNTLKDDADIEDEVMSE